MKRLVLIAMVAALVLLAACSSMEKKPLSKDAINANELFELAEGLRAAYVAKDMDELRRLCTPEAYRSLVSSMRKFDKVELKFNPRWVQMESKEMELNVAWTGTWTYKGDVTEKKGMAVFMMEGYPPKLTKIVKGSPFIYP